MKKLKVKISKKRLLKNIFIFMAGVAFSAGTLGVSAAILLASSEVGYTGNGQSSVEGALNDLYNKVAAAYKAPNQSEVFASHTLSSVQATINTTKWKNDDVTDTNKTAWTNWTTLGVTSGAYNSTTGADTSSITTTSWVLDINKDNFYKARYVSISLYCYDNTQASLDKSGDTDFYTRMYLTSYTGTDNASHDVVWGIVPYITIYKPKNSYSISQVVSSVDVSRDQNKLSYNSTTAVLTESSIYRTAGFWASFKDDKLILTYSAEQRTDSSSYSGVRRYACGSTGEDNFLASDASDAFEMYGTDVTGTYCFYYKKEGTIVDTYAAVSGRLQSRYNYWSIPISYRG